MIDWEAVIDWEKFDNLNEKEFEMLCEIFDVK